jgi:hypothetical protein
MYIHIHKYVYMNIYIYMDMYTHFYEKRLAQERPDFDIAQYLYICIYINTS